MTLNTMCKEVELYIDGFAEAVLGFLDENYIM